MTTTLAARLTERIERDGPIPFAAFMEAALYDPDGGFYQRAPVGPRGDFVTSPHVSGGFGSLLARQVDGMWELLGRPGAFDVVEAGAGDGTLAKQIRAAARAPLRYTAVEIGAAGRAALAQAGVDAVSSLAEAPPMRAGCVLANELLDNLPFHRLRVREGRLVEVFVGVEQGRFVEVERAPTVDAAVAPRNGEEAIVSPAAAAFVRDAIALVERGWVVLYDYGSGAGEDALPARAYEAHRLHDALLENPGAADITAGADFGAIAAVAREAGAAVHGPCAQRDVLKALGFDDWYASLRERRLRAEAERDTKSIMTLLSEQSRAPLLVDRAHLGGLKAIAFGVGVDAPPPGFG